ncbi:Glycine/sarcosine N-methyltransferase [compost metagenome]
MNFYEKLSEVYDVIFPTNQDTVHFLSKQLPSGGCVLDIACATGGYASALATLGYQVEAIDLDKDMIQQARERKDAGVHWIVGNMTKVRDYYNDSSFDLIYCIGNSIVHLDHKEDVINMITDCRQLLRNDGRLVIGAVNYNRIITNQISGLPTIERKENNISFERKYQLDSVNNKILFETKLVEHVDNKEVNFESSVPLLPLYEEELCSIAYESGFSKVELYGGFHEEPYEPLKSASVVMVAS